MLFKNFLFTAILIVVTIVFSLGIGEILLRLKNTNMRDYDIEMWRYSKELKRKSENPLLGHVHIPFKEAILQSVEIRINSDGLRGNDIRPKQKGVRRILILGSSITLGWGVVEDDTMTERLNQMFKKDGNSAEVINAGVGNYNTVRYVEQFLTRLTHLDPNIIVVQYFVNDAEVLNFYRGDWFLRNSQLAVRLWTAYNRLFRSNGKGALVEHYEAVYNPGAKGFKDMALGLKRLAAYAKEKEIKIILAMTPDLHDLKDYSFDFIHHDIAKISSDLGFVYVDLLSAFRGLDAKSLWSMPGDPHPNSFGHELMANMLYPFLKTSDLKNN